MFLATVVILWLVLFQFCAVLFLRGQAGPSLSARYRPEDLAAFTRHWDRMVRGFPDVHFPARMRKVH